MTAGRLASRIHCCREFIPNLDNISVGIGAKKIRFPRTKFAFIENFPAGFLPQNRSILWAFLTLTLIAGCASTKQEQVSEDPMIQKRKSGPEVHGEAGVMYGRSG